MESLERIIENEINNNPNCRFKKCTFCNKELPATKMFFHKQKNGLYGFTSKCRKCTSEDKNFRFIKDNWYGTVDELYADYRKMSRIQLENKYKKSTNAIIRVLKKENVNTDKSSINKNLSEEEVIFMYESLLKNQIKSFSNGMFTEDTINIYSKYILQHLINNILKWNKEDIINNFNINVLKDYKATIIMNIKYMTVNEFVCSVFSQYDISPWEFKASSVGKNFWNKDENVKNALKWFKEKIKNEKNIVKVMDLANYSLTDLISEYELDGLLISQFESSSKKFFENVFEEKIYKEDLIKNKFNFNIRDELVLSELKYNNILYSINQQYYTLDSVGKTLINNLILQCEEKGETITVHNINKNFGGIAKSQYKKYFGKESVSEYITFIKPKKKTKTKTKKSTKNQIYLNYSTEQLYEHLQSNKRLPLIIYKYEDIMINFLRFIITNKLGLTEKTDICDPQKLNSRKIKKFKIESFIYRLGGKLSALQKCFPELDIKYEDVFKEKYNKKAIISIIDEWLRNENIKIEDILQGSLISSIEKSKEMNNLRHYFNREGKSSNEMFLYYFKEKNIKHPKYDRDIDIYDFKHHCKNFYSDTKNRITKVKRYCEEVCEDSILNNMNNEDLRQWVKNNFTQVKLSKELFAYGDYHKSIYETLVEAYPSILEDKILFDWEWTQCNKTDKKTLLRMLREFVKYRMKDYIKNEIEDIPKYMNPSDIGNIEPKLIKHIHRGRFENFYEWCCEAFPEYKNKWSKEDFGRNIAFDGTELDSNGEKTIYEYIKRNVSSEIISIGRKRNGKYIFKPNKNKYTMFCPDFVIESIKIKDEKIKIKKPIIIEYFGMYTDKYNTSVIKRYRDKTKEKEKYYNSNNDIIFIGIYPEDLNNNLYGLKIKLGDVLAYVYDRFNL